MRRRILEVVVSRLGHFTTLSNHQVAWLAVAPPHDAGRKACPDDAVAQH
jgi:hypothetical protein